MLTDTIIFEKEQSLLRLIDVKLLDHNVYTPFPLCREIINQLGDLNNKNILVLYSYEMAYLLVKEYNCDPTKVTLVGQATNKVKTTLAQKLGINYCDVSWINSTRSCMSMKFDVIVGNPPYDLTKSKKIWPDFVKRSFDLTEVGGTVALVTPTSWLNSNGSVYKNIRTVLTSNFNVKIISRDAKSHFMNVGIDICYWVATHENYTNKTIYIKDGEYQIIDLKHGVPASKEIQAIESLVQKISEHGPGIKWILNDKGTRKVAANSLKSQPTSTHTYRTYQSTKNIGYLDRDLGDFGKLKLAVNYSSAFYNSAASDYNMPITSDNIGSLMGYIFISSEDEGKKIRSYLCSKAVRWLVANYKKQNTGFSDAVKRCIIPEVPVKEWTDVDVYKQFGLSQDEINLIESTIK